MSNYELTSKTVEERYIRKLKDNYIEVNSYIEEADYISVTQLYSWFYTDSAEMWDFNGPHYSSDLVNKINAGNIKVVVQFIINFGLFLKDGLVNMEPIVNTNNDDSTIYVTTIKELILEYINKPEVQVPKAIHRIDCTKNKKTYGIFIYFDASILS